MKIFGSISELVDLAFRLAGGKQVKLRAATQTTSGNLVTVNVPDVAATGDTQSMVLNAATQTLSNKTLSSPTISGGTINNSIIGGSTPAAGTFTDIVGSTLDINTSAELQTLTIPSFSTAGILHNNSSGAVSSSLIVNADVDAAAAIAFSKLATLASGNILVGSSTGVPTSRAVTGDVTIDDLGATTIGASKVLNSMLAGNIDRSKLSSGTNYRILANNASGVMSENAALTANEAVATDANGQLVSVTGVSATELGYLSNVTSDIQTQINGKASSGANSDITSLTGLTTMLAPSQGGTGVNNGSNTLTLAGPLTTSGNFTTTLAVTNNTSLTLPTSGTLATTSNKLSAFAATSSSELAGVISDETGSGLLVFATSPSLTTPTISNATITGGTVRGAALDRLAVESDNAAIASGTLVPSKGLMIITAGDNTLNTLNPGVGFNLVNGAVLTVINNEGADVTVTNAGNIQTGTGSDFTLKQGAASSFIWSTTLSKWVLSGGAGSSSATVAGFVNYITNADAQSDTTGWATYADAAGAAPVDGTGGTANVVWDRNTSSPLRGNADFAFVKDAANRQGQGVAFAFTIATTDRSKKCQISFDYDTSAANYAAGDMRVYVYDVTNATLITPQTVAIPKGTNTFQTTFDTTTSTSYRLILHVATTNATAYTVDFDNFVVNAGQVVQGAAISEWQSYSATLGGTTADGTITYTSRNTQWRRVGSNMEIKGTIEVGTVTSSPTGFLRWFTPAGFTVAPGSEYICGDATFQGSSSIADLAVITQTTQPAAVIILTSSFGTTPALTAGAFIKVNFSVPIAEWTGNGTVNLGAGAQVEYAATSGTWDADSSTTVYGPAGQALGGTLAAARTKTVTWQYPIQADDQIVVEFSRDGTTWAPANGFRFSTAFVIQGLDSAGGEVSGVYCHNTSSTQTVVTFGRYANIANDDAPAANWPSSNAFWRVRKAKASAPVGFGLAKASESGLVAPRKGQQSLTVTSSLSGWATTRAVGIYYQDQDGNHRLKFNIQGSFSSTTYTTSTTTISGVTFKNGPLQAIWGFTTGSAPGAVIQSYTNSNASTIVLLTASGTTITGLCLSGDVELESRPTWA